MNTTSAYSTATPRLELLEATGDCSYTFMPQSIHGHMLSPPECLSPAGSSPIFDAVGHMAFTPASTTSFGTYTDIAQQLNHTYPNESDAWSMPFLDANSVAPQLIGDPNWRAVSPLAVYSVAASSNQVVSPSSSATPPASQNDWAWFFETGQSKYPTPSSLSSEGLVALGYGAPFNGIPIPSAEWDFGGLSRPTPATPVTPAHIMARGKRRRDETSEAINRNGIPPQKRFKSGEASGIKKASRSVAQTRHKPANRIPKTNINTEPKEVGRRAEGLATLDSPRVQRPPLLGPGFQQGWAEEDADGKLIWVEGSVEEKVTHNIDSTVQQHQQPEANDIPREMDPDHKALLVATENDWDNMKIPEIRCRVCPNTSFKTWENFKRHCDTVETHPFKISICSTCGDFFARSDALDRHNKRPPPECPATTREKADAKRDATKRLHEEFVGRLRTFLATGEEFGKPFCEIIKGMFPNSSKKCGGSRKMQSGLEGQ